MDSHAMRYGAAAWSAWRIAFFLQLFFGYLAALGARGWGGGFGILCCCDAIWWNMSEL
jgi:hypothetical protein